MANGKVMARVPVWRSGPDRWCDLRQAAKDTFWLRRASVLVRDKMSPGTPEPVLVQKRTIVR